MKQTNFRAPRTKKQVLIEFKHGPIRGGPKHPLHCKKPLPAANVGSESEILMDSTPWAYTPNVSLQMEKEMRPKTLKIADLIALLYSSLFVVATIAVVIANHQIRWGSIITPVLGLLCLATGFEH